MILIVGKPIDSENFGLRSAYMRFFGGYGNILVSTPINQIEFEKLAPLLDLVVLPGGADINPERYGQAPHPFTQKADIFLDHADKTILPWAIEKRIPVFGICRGLQAINVHFGGTLIQENGFYHPRSAYFEEIAHPVKLFTPGTQEFIKYEVNSLHHQSVDKLGQNLEVIATAKDGTIEGILSKTDLVAAVQWHPESLPPIRWLENIFNQIGFKC